MCYPRHHRLIATVVLCNLLLQGCKSGLYSVTKESDPEIVREIDDDRALGSSEDSAVAPNLHTGPPTESVGAHHGVLAGKVSAELSASQSLGVSSTSVRSVVPASSHQCFTTAAARIMPPSDPRESAVDNALDVQPSSKLVTTSSDERTPFSQQRGQWPTVSSQELADSPHPAVVRGKSSRGLPCNSDFRRPNSRSMVSLRELPRMDMTPAMAFGAKAWKKYFGEVGTEPSLPSSIGQILNGRCPFWPGRLVKDTHLLVLIPATVAGRPFSLDLLEELIQCPRGAGHPTAYRYYDSNVQAMLGSQSPSSSYWVLMTRKVLEGSRNKDYASQKDLVSRHASRTGLPYELPGALEAATAILSHYVRGRERLYSDNPRTWTRCRESVRMLLVLNYSVVVGGFSTGGLFVNNDDYCDLSDSYSDYHGVAVLRRFPWTDVVPAMAFGARAWKEYFGEVGTEPLLPSDINQMLDSPCPFWPGKAVKDTHLLVLIPARVAGRPFSLDLLGELIQRPRGGSYSTKYRYYHDGVQKVVGAQSPAESYWVLMTRSVLEGSKGKGKDHAAAHEAMVAQHAGSTDLPYRLPGALEAATAILSHYVRSGERLYSDSPWTYARCQELVDNQHPVIVGGFSSGGIYVSGLNGDCYDDFFHGVGVASLQKF
jgi:hypothetical protein